MKKIALTLIVLVFFGCTTKKEEEPFKVPDNYRSWDKATKKVLDYPVPGHGASFRIVYANDIAFSARLDRKNKRLSMPDGSIVIKETYAEREDIPKKFKNLTIMVKDKKNKKSLNGWFYYMQAPDMKPMRIDGRMCMGCHEAANEEHPYFDKNPEGLFRDYLFIKIAK